MFTSPNYLGFEYKVDLWDRIIWKILYSENPLLRKSATTYGCRPELPGFHKVDSGRRLLYYKNRTQKIICYYVCLQARTTWVSSTRLTCGRGWSHACSSSPPSSPSSSSSTIKTLPLESPFKSDDQKQSCKWYTHINILQKSSIFFIIVIFLMNKNNLLDNYFFQIILLNRW